jgi:hypothetical protein
MDFIFASTILIVTIESSRTTLYFSMFSKCHNSRRFAESCHRLLVCFDTPIPDPDKVRQLSDQAFGQDAKTDLFDYVDGKVSISQAQTAALSAKLEEDVVAKFRRTNKKNYNNRKAGDQLVIMRHVVLCMFVKHEGNQIDTSKKTPQPVSAVRKALADPMVATPQNPASQSAPPQKPPRVQVDRPTLFDELAITAPTNLHQNILAQSVIDNPIPPTSPYESHHSNLDHRFAREKCAVAAADEVAPFAPRVYVEGKPCLTNLCCAPFEFYLLGDLKNKFHGFTCDNLGLQPSVSKAITAVWKFRCLTPSC